MEELPRKRLRASTFESCIHPNHRFLKLLSSPEAFQLLTNSKVPKACNILLLGEKWCSEMKGSALSSRLIPSRTGTVRSLPSLCGSAPQGHASWRYVPWAEQTEYPLDHSRGLSRETCSNPWCLYNPFLRAGPQHQTPGSSGASRWQ